MRSARRPNLFTGKMSDPKNDYVPADSLSEELRKSKALGQWTPLLAEYIGKITKAVRNFPRFRKLDRDWLDEMESYSNLCLVKNMLRVANPDHPHLFSYITTAVANNMQIRRLQLAKKQKKHIEYVKAVLEKCGKTTYDNALLDGDQQEDT